MNNFSDFLRNLNNLSIFKDKTPEKLSIRLKGFAMQTLSLDSFRLKLNCIIYSEVGVARISGRLDED